MKLYSIIKFVLFLIIILLIGLYMFKENNHKLTHHKTIKHLNYSNIDLSIKEEITNIKIKTLTDVLWCENRASKTSMELILSVIFNRAKEKSIDGLYAEIIKPYQFSCLNTPIIISTQKNNKKDKEMYIVAKQIVNTFLNNKFSPITTATFYYSPKKVGKLPMYLKDKPLLIAFEGHHYH